MPMPPTVYADMLARKIRETRAQVWLVNTGWTGGPYGVGQRMKIGYTRAMVKAVLDGSLAKAPTRKDPHFGLRVPTSCPNVPSKVLNPRDSWADPMAYDAQAQKLVAMFQENYRQFQ